jgi:hypothetical protein
VIDPRVWSISQKATKKTTEMGSSTNFIATVAAAIAFVLLIDSAAVAQLSREDKQVLLDAHNRLRASVRAADMNQLVSEKNIIKLLR